MGWVVGGGKRDGGPRAEVIHNDGRVVGGGAGSEDPAEEAGAER